MVSAAIGEAGSVLNRPLETVTGAVGLRPKLVGAITFQDLTFTYSNTTTPALDRVNFSIPAGTMLGLVGRSGSGKSTVTRLLQGINRDYRGYLKVDGIPLAGARVTIEVGSEVPGGVVVSGLPPEIELIREPRRPSTAV